MDTSSIILAVASPPGRSSRGIIRISGAAAFELLDGILRLSHSEASEEDGSAPPLPRGAFHAHLHLSECMDVPVYAFIFPAPHSYTGENSIELQLPGNPILLDRVIDGILSIARQLRIDARRAEPGEFTARAFLSGRLTLTQAEGVAATIAAQSDAELRAAQLLTSGILGAFAHRLADELASALALVEAGIDFTDQEDVVAITPADLHERLTGLRNLIADQLVHSVGMEQLQAIPWVVLAGEPNAGKSALFNALLRRERAVVSPVCGTTRDVLAEPLTIPTAHGPAEVMLIDLAGLDDQTDSSINRLMQQTAREAIDRAELTLRCVPANQHQPHSLGTDEILVRTKSDLVRGEGESQSLEIASSSQCPTASISDHFTSSSPQSSSFVSAFTGQGLNDLKRLISARLSDRAVSLAGDALALRPRHEAALRSALANLSDALVLVETHRSARSLPDSELIASSMRAGLDDLAALAGDITPDEVLGRVFAAFCIGK